MKSRLFNSGKPEHHLIIKPRHTPHTVTCHFIDKMIDALFVLGRQLFHIVLKLDGNTETERNDSADLPDPVIHFLAVCADHHIHERSHSLFVRKIRVERDKTAVTLRKIIVLVKLFV